MLKHPNYFHFGHVPIEKSAQVFVLIFEHSKSLFLQNLAKNSALKRLTVGPSGSNGAPMSVSMASYGFLCWICKLRIFCVRRLHILTDPLSMSARSVRFICT